MVEVNMRCNACWQELEGRAISTTCGHLLCTEDANKILSGDGACPICDQVLSKSMMKLVDINPNDEWINMAMAGTSPHILMKSVYRSVMFFIGQKDLEMQYNMNKIVARCRQKCEGMQGNFTEKLEQVHTAYQKMAKRCQMLEQEFENLSKDKQELQEKLSEKSRQKRKLDEIYDQLRSEFDLGKQTAIQPARCSYPRTDSDLFPNPAKMMENRDHLRQDRSTFLPDTPGEKEDMWPMLRQNKAGSGPFGSGRQVPISGDVDNRRPGTRPHFATAGNNPALTLRNLIISPVNRPQPSRNRAQLFTL